MINKNIIILIGMIIKLFRLLHLKEWIRQIKILIIIIIIYLKLTIQTYYNHQTNIQEE